MRILRSPTETPDFDNLLVPPGEDQAGANEALGLHLPDPFGDAPPLPEPPIEPPARAGELFPGQSLGPYRPSWRESTFLRAIGLGFAPCVMAFDEWGRRSGRQGAVHLGHGRLVIPDDVASASSLGRCSIRVRLRRGAPCLRGVGVPSPLSVPMELELVPWPAIFDTTWLVLVCRRRVRLSRRYFRSGHALLDEVTAGLLGYAS